MARELLVIGCTMAVRSGRSPHAWRGGSSNPSVEPVNSSPQQQLGLLAKENSMMNNSSEAAVRVPKSVARAHEQKNCLSIILAVASLVTPELSDGSRERMARLRAAAHRLRELMNADLDGADDEMATLDVRALFGAVCDALRDRAEDAHVVLVVDGGGGRVRAVEGELHEALFNIIANAIEATPPHRTVLIHTERTLEGGQLWTVHDSGSGMCTEVLEQIGVPHRTFRPGGSGLGVALAKGIIDRYGGSLRFDSVCGRGTTVTITLPHEACAPLPRAADESVVRDVGAAGGAPERHSGQGRHKR